MCNNAIMDRKQRVDPVIVFFRLAGWLGLIAGGIWLIAVSGRCATLGDACRTSGSELGFVAGAAMLLGAVLLPVLAGMDLQAATRDNRRR